MKKTMMTAILLGMIVLLTPQTSRAATLLGDFLKDKGVDVSGEVTLDFYDKYEWRGFKLDSDNVLQPGLTLSAAGFEAGFWGSWDVESNDANSTDEADVWLGYSFDLGFIDEDYKFISISLGNTWYSFPETNGYTTETYLGLALDVPLSPYFTWYSDYGSEDHGGADGNYYMFGIGHSFELEEDYGITLDLGYELGLNDGAFINGEGGYNLLTAGLSVPLTENASLAPSIGYSIPFGDLEDPADGNQDDEFYGGVSLAVAF